jgi:hypothetical protein
MITRQIKKKRYVWLIALFSGALLSLSFTASAISVKLTADRNGTYVDENMTLITIMANESVKFQIQVYEGTETSSGAFSIYEKVAEKTYKLVGKPHFAFAACSCTGSREMPDLNEEYTFIPLSPGKYRAEAQYGGVSKKMDITVMEIIPEAISTTTSTTKSPSSTIPPASTTAPQASSTTTTLEEEPTTTLDERNVSSPTTLTKGPNKTELSFPWLPALLGLAIVSAFFLFVLKKRGGQSE